MLEVYIKSAYQMFQHKYTQTVPRVFLIKNSVFFFYDEENENESVDVIV